MKNLKILLFSILSCATLVKADSLTESWFRINGPDSVHAFEHAWSKTKPDIRRELHRMLAGELEHVHEGLHTIAGMVVELHRRLDGMNSMPSQPMF